MRGVLISGVFLSSVISGTPLIPMRTGIWRGSHKQMPLISKAGGTITIEDNDVYPVPLSIDLLQNYLHLQSLGDIVTVTRLETISV